MLKYLLNLLKSEHVRQPVESDLEIRTSSSDLGILDMDWEEIDLINKGPGWDHKNVRGIYGEKVPTMHELLKKHSALYRY